MIERAVSFLLGVSLATVMTSTQSTPPPARTGSQLLVLPRPGIPISFEHIEKHSPKSGSDLDYANTGKTYRDSSGRLRMESETHDGTGHVAASYIALIDPVAGSQTVLFTAQSIGYQIPISVSSEGRFAFFDAYDGQESPHKWKTGTEDLGKRIIEGIEFRGTRRISTAEDEPRLATTLDEWHSDKFKLIGAIDRSGPYMSYSTRIQNVHHEEPDPTLFRIPSGYKIVDMQLPSHGPLNET